VIDGLSITRRRLLGGVAGAAGIGSGAPAPERHVVGTDGPEATDTVARRATSVDRVLEFGAIG